MSKIICVVGFVEQTDDGTGIFRERGYEVSYMAESKNKSIRYDSADKAIDDISLNEELSIVCDSLILNKMGSIKYVRRHNSVWKVTNMRLERPRIILTVGGVYNGKVYPRTACDP